MSYTQDAWTVLPHDPLAQIDEGILTVTGQIQLPLVELQRRMTVVWLNDGTCVIYSGIALEDSEMKRIEAWAAPRYLVVPGDAHRQDAAMFKNRYPEIQVITPPGARKRVEKAVKVDATSADFGDPTVTLLSVAGAGGMKPRFWSAAPPAPRSSSMTLSAICAARAGSKAGSFTSWASATTSLRFRRWNGR